MKKIKEFGSVSYCIEKALTLLRNQCEEKGKIKNLAKYSILKSGIVFHSSMHSQTYKNVVRFFRIAIHFCDENIV